MPVASKTRKGFVNIKTKSVGKANFKDNVKPKNKIKKWSEVNHQSMLEKGYVVDKELSGKDYTTYYNPKTGKASIRYRETDPTNLRDLGTDALIAFGLQGIGSRFKRAEKVYDRAAVKYGGKQNVDVYGHSLGGTQALHVNQTRGAVATAYNPGAGPIEPLKHLYNQSAAFLGNKKAKRRINNQKQKAHVVHNLTDPLSTFSLYGGAYPVTIQYKGIAAHGQSSLGR